MLPFWWQITSSEWGLDRTVEELIQGLSHALYYRLRWGGRYEDFASLAVILMKASKRYKCCIMPLEWPFHQSFAIFTFVLDAEHPYHHALAYACVLCPLFIQERFSLPELSFVFLKQRKELFLLQMLLTSTPELKKLDSEFVDLENEIRSTFEVSISSQFSTCTITHTLLQTFIHNMFFAQLYDLDQNGSIDENEFIEGLGDAGWFQCLCP